MKRACAGSCRKSSCLSSPEWLSFFIMTIVSYFLRCKCTSCEHKRLRVAVSSVAREQTVMYGVIHLHEY